MEEGDCGDFSDVADWAFDVGFASLSTLSFGLLLHLDGDSNGDDGSCGVSIFVLVGGEDNDGCGVSIFVLAGDDDDDDGCDVSIFILAIVSDATDAFVVSSESGIFVTPSTVCFALCWSKVLTGELHV